MKISVKQEIWLDVKDLEWLQEYYDGDWINICWHLFIMFYNAFI